MIDMAAKIEKMIDYLLQANDFVKLDKVSVDCRISKRSVYNYLKLLQEDPKYYVDRKDQSVRLMIKQEDVSKKRPEDYQERKRWIFRKGLIMQKELHIDKLLDYFGISEATFHSDLIRIRKEISKYRVRLVTKKGVLLFVGNYHELKKLTQNIIYEENNEKNALLSIDSLADVFTNLDVHFIKDAIVDEFQKVNYFMDEYSIVNLLIHILVSTNQELNGITPSASSKEIEVNRVISEICSLIEAKYKFVFSKSAKQQFSLILETRTKCDEEGFDTRIIKHTLTVPLVNEIFYKLLVNYNVDINEPVFKRSFALHIDSMLYRLESGVVLNNPLFNIIKQSSPITYDLAVFVSNIISSKTGYGISESEIAYIALHIGTKIEEMQAARTKLKAVIVCPEYYLYNSGLRKIVELYKEDLYVANVYTSFDRVCSLKEIDLIICSIAPHRLMEGVRVLRTSLFLNNEDRKNITDAIVSIKNQKRIDRSKASVLSLFKEELFYSRVRFDCRDDVIKFMSRQLMDLGYVGSTYQRAVLEREEIAPTDFNIIAIPHPAEFSARSTVISVCLLERPLLWSRNSVSIVFMVGINGKDFDLFEDIFSSIIQIAEDGGKARSLLESRDYADFVNRFIELLVMG